jgi:WD40 repeat protein
MENITELDKKTDIQVTMTNPFPGLRPFKQDESHLFFGRESQTKEVLDKLIKNNFIAIIGISGIGKSSFINCGILPKLLGDFPGQISNQWDICSLRPGNNPIKSLAEAFIQETTKRKNGKTNHYQTVDEILEILRTNGSAGFTELVKNYIKSSGKNLILYVDQFEEVFRYKTEEKSVSDETALFIEIITSSVQKKDLPVYAVITMRSDYIGECSRYTDLTAAINDSQFLIPQMTREEKKLAITGPVKVMGGQISPDLVNEILNKIGDDADQLPVMQHALMRTWDYWEQNKIGREEIGLSHYHAIGGMDSALSVHANELFNSLATDKRQICEKIFKSLTEKGEEGRSFRRPATIRELSDIAQAAPDVTKEIVELFRSPGKTIFTPPSDIPLEEETIIDISHESLMRIWGTLTHWIDEEYESTKQYLRIAEAAELHQTGKGGLLKSPELQMATNWYHQESPTKAWGIRHHIAFDRTIEYLLYSEKQFIRGQRLKNRQQRRRLYIARVVALVFGTGAIIAGILFIYAQKQKMAANIQKTEATKQKEIAEEQAIVAEQNAQEAQKQSKIAEIEALRALRNEKIANESRKKAELERQNAMEQKELADKAHQKAVIEEQKALKLRMFSIARSMAIKSLQEPDVVTKSLVSRQAYNFYFDNGGTGTDPDIYNALYYAVKALKGEKYNLLDGHTDNVRSIVTSANSDYFYSTGSDGQVFKWAPSGDLSFEKTLLNHNAEQLNKAMALSSDGNWLVIGGDYNYLLLFSLTNEKQKPQKIKTTSRQTWYIAFTPDNKNIISVGSDKKILLWDFVSAKEVAQPEGKINSIDLDPSGKYLATAMESGEIILYDIKNNFAPKTLYTEKNNTDLTSIKYSENGRMLAIGNIKGTVRILDAESGSIVTSLTGHTAMANQICFNHQGDKLATASFDHTVRIWDLDNLYNQPIVLNDHKDWVWSVAFSKDDNYLFAGCRDKLVRAWMMDINKLSTIICLNNLINRNLNDKEWETYVAEDVEMECTCKKNCSN